MYGEQTVIYKRQFLYTYAWYPWLTIFFQISHVVDLQFKGKRLMEYIGKCIREINVKCARMIIGRTKTERTDDTNRDDVKDCQE